jgi:hypothetical protein
MYHQRHDFILPADDRTELQAFQTGFDVDGNAGVARSRKGYFARLLHALHESRRLQAARVIRQYRHLVANRHDFTAAASVSKPNDFITGNIAMANTDYARARQRGKSISLRAWVLIAVIGFGALHVVGAIVLIHASGSRSAEISTTEMHRD